MTAHHRNEHTASRAADRAPTVLRRTVRLVQSLTASVVLLALTGAVPWALWHWIGWPLTTHPPTRETISAALQNPTTPAIMLDLLACLCWTAWAAFTLGVARSVVASARGIRLPATATVGPAHALAAALVGMVLVGLLAPRHPIPTSAPGATTQSTVLLADSTHPGIDTRVVVRSPHDGIHDSLWRIAERTLGDPTRWPEIFAANQGNPHPTGAPFENPDLIYPGEELVVSTGATPEPVPTPPPHNHPPITISPHPGPRPSAPTPPHDVDHRHPHTISWGTDVFVGVALAAAVSAALTLARRRHARDYQPGSGRRDDLHPAPVVYQLHHAHRATVRENPDQHPASTLDVPTVVPVADHRHVTTPLGVDGSDNLTVDLAATHGLGLVGSGAAAAARALLLTLLTDHDDTTALVPAADLTTVLGATRAPQLPSGIRVVDTMSMALDELETETRRRAHTPEQSHHPLLVLVAAAPAPDHPRLRAALDTGSTLAVAAVLVGQWRPGITAYIRDDGTVSATSPQLGNTLRGTLFHLGKEHAAALLDLLHQARPTPATHPAHDTATAPPRTAPSRTGEPDLEIVGAPPTTVTDTPAPPRTARPESARAARHEPAERAVTIHVLGSVQLHIHRPGTAEPRDIAGDLQPRARELITLLALHPDGLTRETLIDALWSGGPPARPTNALHTAITRVRNAISDATDAAVPDIIASHCGTRFNLDRTVVDVDYWHFESAVTARRGAATAATRVAAYRRIIDHYTGPLADGLTTDWIEPIREAARRDFIDAVAALATAMVDHDPHQTLDLLETARHLDPHNELLYRDIMRLQHRLGRSDAVPRTLSLLTARLTEIGETPTTQTQQLVAQIRSAPTARGA